MKKVLIYCRVSTNKQNVEQQAEYCKKWAKNQGYEVIWTIRDKQSGTASIYDRPRFLKIIKDQYNFDYDAVLVYNLDRLTRNWDDVGTIEKYFRENRNKYELLSCSNSIDLSNASGRLMFRMFMALCCQMPEDMLEKQKIGIARAKAEGKFKGGKRGRIRKPKKIRKTRSKLETFK